MKAEHVTGLKGAGCDDATLAKVQGEPELQQAVEKAVAAGFDWTAILKWLIQVLIPIFFPPTPAPTP